MEDIVSPDEAGQKALGLAELIAMHNGENVKLLDLRPLSTWTDFFVIATVTSGVHQRGIMKFVKEYLRQNGMDSYYRRSTGDDDGQDWFLLDCGTVVVHLMSPRAREFYELERLWYQAKTRDVTPK